MPFAGTDEAQAGPADRTKRGEDMGYLHRAAGGRTQYVGPSFWGISSKHVSYAAKECFQHDLTIRVRVRSFQISSMKPAAKVQIL